MSNCIIAELSSDTYAGALNVTVHSPSPVLALCRKLIAESTYAPETPLNAYRGKTLTAASTPEPCKVSWATGASPRQ